jgi:hypothetical protein
MAANETSTGPKANKHVNAADLYACGQCLTVRVIASSGNIYKLLFFIVLNKNFWRYLAALAWL